ncbi:MAG: hypothetical protein ACW98Y_12100 [Candidatus Thorarchaeota archaeon]|jgi:hypothetical protein
MNKRKTRMIAASLAFTFVVCALSVGMLALMTHGGTASVFADPGELDHKENTPTVYADPGAQDFRENSPAVWADPAILPFRVIGPD